MMSCTVCISILLITSGKFCLVTDRNKKDLFIYEILCHGIKPFVINAKCTFS